jgi:hypothetical protein
LDEESSLLTTFGTPFGRYKWYKWKRLPFGISPAGEIFQSRLDQAIDDLEGVRTVTNDILVIGNGDSIAEAITDHDEAITDHDVKMKQLLDRWLLYCKMADLYPMQVGNSIQLELQLNSIQLQLHSN